MKPMMIGTIRAIAAGRQIKDTNHRLVRNALLAGILALRVVGSEATGFRLAGERKDGVLLPFGQTYSKQVHAVTYGQTKFNLKAIKVAPNNARNQRAA